MADNVQPPDFGIQRLRLVELPAFVERVKAERWTALAIVPRHSSRFYKRPDVPSLHVVVVDKSIGSAGAEALSRLLNLTLLHLVGNQLGDAGAEALSRLSNLISLDLEENRIGDAGAEALSRLSNLTALDLADNQIGDHGAEALSRLSNLTALDLADNQIGDDGAKALSYLSNLTALNLAGNQIGTAGAEALSRLSNLTSLDLGGNQIGDAGAETLSRLSNLTSLDLAGNQVSAASAEALSRLSRLTALDLGGNQIGDAGAEVLSRLSNLTSLDLGGNQIGDAGAEALSRLSSVTWLDLSANRITDAGTEALSRLSSVTSLDLRSNQIGDAGAEALSRLSSLTSLGLSANQIGDAGGRTLLDAWANSVAAERRRFLHLEENNIGELLPVEVLKQTDAQTIIAAWRGLHGLVVGGMPLPEPDSVDGQSQRGLHVGTTPEGALVVLDPAAGPAARTDALALELHAETVSALDALVTATARSNALAYWRVAAEEAKERLGDDPEHVQISVILRIERLRALREADERRRGEPDPLVEPAEPGAAAALREAVAAANLYIATDPWLDEQQRRIADPGTQPVLPLEEAMTAEANLNAAHLAEETLLDELRNARETAETGGEAGRRAQIWLSESWRNIVIEATRQALAWLRDATLQARIGVAITVDDAAEVIAETGIAARLAAMRAAKAAGDSASRIWQHAEPELGKRLAQATVASGFLLFVGYNLPLVTRLAANADLVAALQRLFGG